MHRELLNKSRECRILQSVYGNRTTFVDKTEDLRERDAFHCIRFGKSYYVESRALVVFACIEGFALVKYNTRSVFCWWWECVRVTLLIILSFPVQHTK